MAARKYPVKITVYKKFDCTELEDYPEGGCKLLEVGQEFMAKEDGKMPEGFCPWAWNDLGAVVMSLRFGANFTYSKTPGTYWGSCTDGRSPVVFKLERIEA